MDHCYLKRGWSILLIFRYKNTNLKLILLCILWKMYRFTWKTKLISWKVCKWTWSVYFYHYYLLFYLLQDVLKHAKDQLDNFASVLQEKEDKISVQQNELKVNLFLCFNCLDNSWLLKQGCSIYRYIEYVGFFF